MKLALPTAQKDFPWGKTTILLCRIDLKRIQEQGRQFQWKNPGSCPNCKGPRIWGHGFVLRYFAVFAVGLWMKRWRCPDCGAVHTVRPETNSPGCQYSKEVQIKSIYSKLCGKPFLKTINRQLQQHWFKNFKLLCMQDSNWNKPHNFLRQQVLNNQFHLTKRRIYSANWPDAYAPYLSFAVTVKQPHFKLE